MKKRILLSILAVGAFCILFPEFIEAVPQGTDKFSGADINSQAKEISSFLFGPVMKIAGVLGGAYGLIMSVLSSSIQPLITFGGIGLAVNIVPKFIESVFSMILP